MKSFAGFGKATAEFVQTGTGSISIGGDFEPGYGVTTAIYSPGNVPVVIEPFTTNDTMLTSQIVVNPISDFLLIV